MKISFFKLVSLTFSIALALSLAACGATPTETITQQKTETPAVPEPKFIFQVGFSSSDDTQMAIDFRTFKNAVEKDTNGQVLIDLYGNGVLGTDSDLVQSVMVGNVSMGAMATSAIATYIPELAVFDIPCVFTDYQATRNMLDGNLTDRLNSLFEKKGLTLLLIVPQGLREMTSNKEIKNFDDFKGLKIRTMDNKYHIAFWKALGAVPVPLAFNDLYIGLQQGVVQAQENPFQPFLASKLYEQQKYIMNTNHIMFFTALYMNKKMYDELPEDLRNIIDKDAKALADMQFNSSEQAEKEALALLKSKGLQEIALTEDTYKKMQEASKPVCDMIRRDIGDDMVDAFLSAYARAAK